MVAMIVSYTDTVNKRIFIYNLYIGVLEDELLQAQHENFGRHVELCLIKRITFYSAVSEYFSDLLLRQKAKDAFDLTETLDWRTRLLHNIGEG